MKKSIGKEKRSFATPRRERIIISEEEYNKLPLILRADHNLYCIVAKGSLVFK